MARQRETTPTPAELAVLQVLWDRGPSTVRQVHEALEPQRSTAYTTTLKVMQIMAEKGLVTRDEAQRSHVYAPAQPQGRMQKHLVGELVEKAFAGSAARLVLNALESGDVSPEELAEIRRLIHDLEGKP